MLNRMRFGPGHVQSNMDIWRDCCTIRFVAASGVVRYQNRLEVDDFWHFTFYALPFEHVCQEIVKYRVTKIYYCFSFNCSLQSVSQQTSCFAANVNCKLIRLVKLFLQVLIVLKYNTQQASSYISAEFF